MVLLLACPDELAEVYGKINGERKSRANVLERLMNLGQEAKTRKSKNLEC